MSSVLSPSWYRVAALKPRLREHFEIHRNPFGNELAYLLQDHSAGKFYRFNVNTYDILGRMNGQRTVHDIWEATVAALGDDAPTQDETIALLGRLHSSDALHVDVTPDCLELFTRAQRNNKPRWRTWLRNPLSIKLPLFDPERALNVIMPIVGPLFSLPGFVVWLALVCWAIFLAAANWTALTFGAADQILDPGNLLSLVLVYPLVKALHEFGHAITTRKWGGEVHEMGITLLVFVPIPYVDASAAAAIRSKFQRIVVSAAGMMVELFLASIALLVWLNVEPGIVRLTAYNVMLISGVSTLLFNGNPLLRFDSYFILKDAIEIPNLASRSSRYLLYLTQRYLFGITQAQSPVTRPGERGWFVFYGIASTLYRLFMTITIALFIAGQYFIIGVLLAAWALCLQVALPIGKAMKYLFFDQSLHRHRARAVGLSMAALAVCLGFVFFMPVPSSTQAQGVLWPPESAHVQAQTDGVVTKLLAAPYSRVRAGQPLLTLEAPTLLARIGILEAELEELRIQRRTEERADPVKAGILKEQMASKRAELDRERERHANLIVRSKHDGVFITRQADELTGRLLRQGEQIGFVLDRASMTVRVAIPQDRIGLVRESVTGVQVKLAESIGHTIAATLTRRVPAAQSRLPSKVLGSDGGGAIAVNPNDDEGLTPLNSVFLFDVVLRDEPDEWRIGQRAFVKFAHGHQPLAQQWYRQARQLFIRQFGV